MTSLPPGAARLPRATPLQVQAMLGDAPEQWERFPRAGDRAAWGRVATRLGPDVVATLTASGREAAERPVPALPLSLWRAFRRTGERPPYETPCYERRLMLTDLLLAYGLAPEAELLEALCDLVWAVCEETSWCFPAHDPREFPAPDAPVVDLFASLTAVALAEVLAVLGTDLPAPLAERVRREVDHRVVTPYLSLDTWPWLYDGPEGKVSNWTAVCAFGAVGAACYLERDDARLATLLCKAARSVEDYLESFDPDGGTSEGVMYWSFGFGSFCQLADLVERRTGGAWSWFEAPIVREVALFPLRSRLTGDAWVTFSDVDADPAVPGWLLHDLGTRFGVPDLRALATGPSASWTWTMPRSPVTNALRGLFCEAHGRRDTPPPVPAASDWFRGLQWLVSRADPADPRALAVAVKGGHNAEMHNQNDVGALIVRCGGEDLVVDPGRGAYTRDYFNDLRYTHRVNTSRAHSVPAPGGAEQRAGAEYRAQVRSVHRGGEGDSVRYDLTRAYPDDCGLTSLHRTVELERGDTPFARLTDAFAFAAEGVAESAFVTFADVEVRDGHVLLHGGRAALRICPPPATTLEVDVEEEELTLFHGPRTLRRVVFRTPSPVREATLGFTLHPHD